MKVLVDANEIRIKGDAVGDKRHIKVYCSTDNGQDYYSISVIKDGFEIGCGGIFYIDKNHVIHQTCGKKEFIN